MKHRSLFRFALTFVGVGAITLAAVPAQAGIARGSFHQTNLVSDIPGRAQTLDKDLKNPWGLSSSPTSPIWVSDNNAGVSTLYNGAGQKVPLTVTIPAPGGGPGGTPTGTVQFKADGTPIGGPVALAGGTASVATTTLAEKLKKRR